MLESLLYSNIVTMKLLYTLYNISKMRPKLYQFISKTATELNVSKYSVVVSMVADMYRHNTYFYDYFEYRFFDKTEQEKQTYCDRLLIHKFHKRYNSDRYTEIFTNKLIFPKYFKSFISHRHFILGKDNYNEFQGWVAENSFERFVIKHPTGQAGSGVIVCQVDTSSGVSKVNGQSLKAFHAKCVAEGYTLAEEYLVQHEVMQSLYPGSVNTIRVISLLHESGVVDILGTMVRIGLDKSVDNFSVGGISAEIDPLTGIIRCPGLTRDPFDFTEYATHPKTGYPILGLQIPFWQETMALVKEAAQVIPEVRTIGWDVAITSKGPSLIEGNQNWDKNHWELTYKEGFRSVIERYLQNQNVPVT